MLAPQRGRGSVVKHHLAKVRVAGSNPVVRSTRSPLIMPHSAERSARARDWREIRRAPHVPRTSWPRPLCAWGAERRHVVGFHDLRHTAITLSAMTGASTP